ncbi:YdcF family protein [Kaistia algarum]|uniref:YdcF family protein n=1 Tax=Kaistia algarum TaxID=2083279 RepID=UPI000CE7417E|nr:YdcF family protein [Kaistia algarum]MCX5515257.1 YdcF family protein [Kaistia algarum]PPE79965.1 YdcF family protein [Kaistia algarum]
MFFYLAKLGWYFAQPSALLLVLLFVGLVAIGLGCVRSGGSLVLVSTAGLLIAGFLPLGPAMMLPLEDRFPRTDPKGPVAGIVVLGGAIDTRISESRGDYALADAAERMTEAVRLARLYPEAKIVFTGGSADVIPDGSTESDPARAFLLAMGLPADRLIIEGRSRDTAENARFTKELVQPKPGETWLLVTSAWHMPRSIGCFRAVGWDVTAWPTDYRTSGPADLWSPMSRPSSGLAMVDLAAKEWIGLVAYRIAGRTDALFPGP